MNKQEEDEQNIAAFYRTQAAKRYVSGMVGKMQERYQQRLWSIHSKDYKELNGWATDILNGIGFRRSAKLSERFCRCLYCQRIVDISSIRGRHTQSSRIFKVCRPCRRLIDAGEIEPVEGRVIRVSEHRRGLHESD